MRGWALPIFIPKQYLAYMPGLDGHQIDVSKDGTDPLNLNNFEGNTSHKAVPIFETFEGQLCEEFRNHCICECWFNSRE